MTDLFVAALGNRAIPDGMIGYEPVTRATRLLLHRDLNDEIDRQSDHWREADLLMQEWGFDPGVGQVDVQHVTIDHLHEGPHESLIEAPASSFPNVSVMAYTHVPRASQGYDQIDVNDITMFVEAMVVAGPVAPGTEVTFETIVHRRIQRTTEAIFSVIAGDKMLLGTVMPQELPPVGGIGKQAWIRNEKAETGKRYMWHGSRLQYTLQRASTTG